MIKYLFESGLLTVDYINKKGLLFSAASSGHMEMIRFLAGQGAEVDGISLSIIFEEGDLNDVKNIVENSN